MTQLQAQSGSPRRAKSFTYGAAMVVCLILLALLTAVQVAHSHPLGADADRCPLCIVMHSAAPVAAAAMALVLVRIANVAPAFEPFVLAPRKVAKLYTRPPPAVR